MVLWRVFIITNLFTKFAICYFLPREQKEPLLADDVDLDISGPMADVATSASQSPQDEKLLLPNAKNIFDIDEELANIVPKPAADANAYKHKHDDDAVASALASEIIAKMYKCQRNYSKPCPLGFDHTLSNDMLHECTPPSYYAGPCVGNKLIYKEMTSEAKLQWSRECLALWPCIQCRRDFSAPCPDDWQFNGTQCIPLQDYLGPCKDPQSFDLYNMAMQKAWSQRCHAYWPCV